MSSPIARLSGETRTEVAAEPAVVDVHDPDADAVLDALGSETARALFRAVHESPGPPSELARRLDTSVQNVHYHLSNLETAGVVEEIGTRYSEKGNEMSVYGPAADPIVLVGDSEAGRRDRTALRESVADWAAGLATLALVSVAVQITADRLVGDVTAGFFEPASLGSGWQGLAVLAETVAEPGLLFFLGGLVVFTSAWWRGR